MTQLYVYEPDQASDMLLAKLYVDMGAEGLDDLFSQPDLPLSAFFESVLPPKREFLYAQDEHGIWLAVWFDKLLRGALVSCWIRPGRRGEFAATLTFKRILQSGMRAYGTLLGITRHEHLLPLHYALGYKLVGRMPTIFPGERDGYMISRTPTAKEKARWAGLPPSSEPARGQQAPQERLLEPAPRAVLQPEPPGPERLALVRGLG